MTGTPGNDRLAGTPRADAIRGLAGRDRAARREVAPTSCRVAPGGDSVDAGPGGDLVATSYDGSRDSVRCGPGVDVVNADLTDSVARDCELVGRRLSRDPYTTSDSQHETEVEPDSFTFGRTTVADLPGRPPLSTAPPRTSDTRSRGTTGTTWQQRAPPGPDRREQPGGRAPARERPGRRLRRRARHLADLDACPRRCHHAARDQPLGRRLDVEQRARRSGGTGRRRASRSTRTGSRATTRSRRRSTAAATSSTRTRPTATCSPSPGRTTAGSPGRCPSDIGARPAVGVFPAIRPTGELVVVYLWETGTFGIAASRSADGGATWGRARPDRRRRHVVRDSRLPRVPAPLRGGGDVRARLGGVAFLRARADRGTPSSSRPRPTAPCGRRRER